MRNELEANNNIESIYKLSFTKFPDLRARKEYVTFYRLLSRKQTCVLVAAHKAHFFFQQAGLR